MSGSPSRGPDLAAVLAMCAELPSAVLGNPFGEEVDVFTVRGKMFAMVDLVHSPNRITLKAVPEHAEHLVATHAAITPGYHMNKRHWITIALGGGLDAQTVEDLIGNSYDRVIAAMPKSRRPVA
ncbi:MmcQ/YjbR family DNA-binding protein [Frigoribacterium sp. 2-23]|uniref:MmcQ/YjbR family DNA-binding protein n=1 Tax=Frigoribacterium sp. 2-23 TaxID=3415006 RepID=UPI003C6EEF87